MVRSPAATLTVPAAPVANVLELMTPPSTMASAPVAVTSTLPARLVLWRSAWLVIPVTNPVPWLSMVMLRALTVTAPAAPAASVFDWILLPRWISSVAALTLTEPSCFNSTLRSKLVLLPFVSGPKPFVRRSAPLKSPYNPRRIQSSRREMDSSSLSFLT